MLNRRALSPRRCAARHSGMVDCPCWSAPAAGGKCYPSVALGRGQKSVYRTPARDRPIGVSLFCRRPVGGRSGGAAGKPPGPVAALHPLHAGTGQVRISQIGAAQVRVTPGSHLSDRHRGTALPRGARIAAPVAAAIIRGPPCRADRGEPPGAGVRVDGAMEPLDTLAPLAPLVMREDRHGRVSTLMVTQLPGTRSSASPSLAARYCDRIVHGAHRIKWNKIRCASCMLSVPAGIQPSGGASAPGPTNASLPRVAKRSVIEVLAARQRATVSLHGGSGGTPSRRHDLSNDHIHGTTIEMIESIRPDQARNRDSPFWTNPPRRLLRRRRTNVLQPIRGRLCAHEYARRPTPTDLLFFLAIIYFSGWWYRNEYFYRFGVPRSSPITNDYTLFVHAFSVIGRLPHLDIQRVYKWVFIGVFILLVLFVLYRLSYMMFFAKHPRWIAHYRRIGNSVLKMSVWAFLFYSAFFVSKGAGHYEAYLQLTDSNPKTVEVLFRTGISDNLSLIQNAEIRRLVDQIQKHPIEVKIGLLWRDQYDTYLIVYNWAGKGNNEAPKVLRIDNDYIVGVYSDAGS